MEFRDLKKQYSYLKLEIDSSIRNVLDSTHFIEGKQVGELEEVLANYVGTKYCITCANGTDALQLALMVWGIGKGDAVFIPDFTFFSSGEVVSAINATPIFVDIDAETYNIDCTALETMIQRVIRNGRLIPKAIVSVDLFGQPADYDRIGKIAEKYNMYILEDAAQAFGGKIGERKVCSFGDIATTSFFPAKPFGCYGDGGALFTDNDEWAELLRSYKMHGRGNSKYDNVRIGMNSRLDTLQAAILLVKFPVFIEKELDWEQDIAFKYSEQLKDVVQIPVIKEGFYSSWAQYTIQLCDENIRNGLQVYLKEQGIPSAIYYQKPMHCQIAFEQYQYINDDYPIANRLSEIVLSLPFHPYMKDDEITVVANAIRHYLRG